MNWYIVKTSYSSAHATTTKYLCELLGVPHRQLPDGQPPEWLTTYDAAVAIEAFYRAAESVFTIARPDKQVFCAFASLVALGANDAALISFLRDQER